MVTVRAGGCCRPAPQRAMAVVSFPPPVPAASTGEGASESVDDRPESPAGLWISLAGSATVASCVGGVLRPTGSLGGRCRPGPKPAHMVIVPVPTKLRRLLNISHREHNLNLDDTISRNRSLIRKAAGYAIVTRWGRSVSHNATPSKLVLAISGNIGQGHEWLQMWLSLPCELHLCSRSALSGCGIVPPSSKFFHRSSTCHLCAASHARHPSVHRYTS